MNTSQSYTYTNVDQCKGISLCLSSIRQGHAKSTHPNNNSCVMLTAMADTYVPHHLVLSKSKSLKSELKRGVYSPSSSSIGSTPKSELACPGDCESMSAPGYGGGEA